jgi:HEAT repeat protein
MRGRFWPLLLATALPLCPAAGAGDPKQTAGDEQALKAAKVDTDDKSLLQFFRNRTLDEAGRDKLRALVKDLGADSFRVREKAAQALVERGSVALPFLKEAVKSGDLEVSRRAELCMQRIGQHDQHFDVLAAALRLLAARKPAGAVPTLLDYLPFADADHMTEEVGNALAALATPDGKPDPALVAALSSKEAQLRGAAGEALGRAGVASEKEAVRKLLRDPDAGVRLQVGMALAKASDREAVPVLIELLGEVPQAQGWQVEDFLFRLAEGKEPPTRVLTNDPAVRRQCRADWAAWWGKHGKDIDLARAFRGRELLGYTTIVLLDRDQILELDAKKQVRWKIELDAKKNVAFPLDVQYLPGDRVLVAEYKVNRVTERDLTGKILWEKQFVTPQMAQRLANGNTFICSDSLMVEVNRDGKEVFSYGTENGDRIMKAVKLTNGQVVALVGDGGLLNDPRVVRLDAHGKELSSFSVRMRIRLFGGRLDVLPNGNILVPHHLENKVVEYDPSGKPVWEVAVELPIIATRLRNGNTLVTSMAQNRAVEFNRAGAEVWEYRSDTRVTRALRR